MSYLGRSSEFGVRSRYIYTAAGSETSISGADDNNNSLSFTDGAYVDVYLNGVLLVPAVDYNTTTANTIAGLSALSASDVVEVVVYDVFNVADTVPASTGGTFNGNVTATAFYGDGSNLTGLNTYDTATSSTGFFALPKGTTAQRPVSPANGYVRYNTTDSVFETYQDGAWTTYQPIYDIEYLVVAGGGAGGSSTYTSGGPGAGGGAGGLLAGTLSVSPNTAYVISVGAGGSAVTGLARGTTGTNSSLGSVTASGGGGGGGSTFTLTQGVETGGSGGSGGGGAGRNDGELILGGSGTSGQGNDGGDGMHQAGWYIATGGGGGAGAAGQDSSTVEASGYSGDGGDGVNTYSTWATATSTGDSGYYAGGGGGGLHATGTAGSGGLGGGGNGGKDASGTSGSANTGGGGGAQAAGGSGIVIIRYAGSQRGTGGTVVESGGYTYHTFTSSGSYTA